MQSSPSTYGYPPLPRYVKYDIEKNSPKVLRAEAVWAKPFDTTVQLNRGKANCILFYQLNKFLGH